MSDRHYSDPHLELLDRCGLDVGDVFEFAAEPGDEQAETALQWLEDAEAEVKAAEVKGQLQRAGLLW